MGKANFTMWCPSRVCGKKVFYDPTMNKTDTRFRCSYCNKCYSAEQLEEYGNNMHRVYRLRNSYQSPAVIKLDEVMLEQGINNEW